MEVFGKYQSRPRHGLEELFKGGAEILKHDTW
jgi:hypothetical protein